MSAYCTIPVKRSAALQMLAEGAFDDEMLAELVNVILDKRLYNCIIVNDDDEGEDDLRWATE